MSTTTFRFVILAGLLTGALAQAVDAQSRPVGTEFEVNTYTTGYQSQPSVGLSDVGAFVVVWRSKGQDGSNYGVFGRRFNSAGVAQAGEFQVNSYTTNYQGAPVAGVASSGAFVVVWASTGQDGDGNGVFARRFNSGGIAQGTEFQVNTRTTGSQYSFALGMAGTGAFVVAWSSQQDGSSGGVFAQRFDAAGVAQGLEFQVNAYTTSIQRFPTVGMAADGDFVVAWDSYGQDGSQNGIFARRFDAAGSPQGAEFQVNSYTMSLQRSPSVGMAGDGAFVVAWHSHGQDDGSFEGVFARRFDSGGVAQAVEFQVNTYTAFTQLDPAVGIDSDGDFVVSWLSGVGQDGDNYGIFARFFDADGVAQAVEFQVNTHTTSSQYTSAVGMNGDGDFVVAWSSRHVDGYPDVFAQRYRKPLAVLDIDGNGSVGALTDGLLVLRYLFGFTGATLVTGAFDVVDCTRCNSPAIEAYLATLI